MMGRENRQNKYKRKGKERSIKRDVRRSTPQHSTSNLCSSDRVEQMSHTGPLVSAYRARTLVLPYRGSPCHTSTLLSIWGNLCACI